MILIKTNKASEQYKTLYPKAYEHALTLGEDSGIRNKIITGEQKFIPSTVKPVYGGWVYYLQFFHKTNQEIFSPNEAYCDEFVDYFFLKIGITQDLFGRVKQITKEKKKLTNALLSKNEYIHRITLKKAWYFDETVDIAHIESSLHFLLSPCHMKWEYFDNIFSGEILRYMVNYESCNPTDDHRRMLKKIGVQCKC